MNGPSPESRGRGCLFYGIIAALVLFVLAVVGLFFAYRFVTQSVSSMVNTYTQTNAAPIQSVELPPDRLREIQSRIQSFQKALEEQNETRELALSAEEINGLIAGDSKAQELKNHLFVRIEDDRISGDVSIPLPDVGPLKLTGRYLNGQATFKIALTNQNLWVSMQEVRVGGKLLPSVLQRELAQQNLADELRQDEKTRAFLEKMDRIEITDGRLILQTRGPPEPQ